MSRHATSFRRGSLRMSADGSWRMSIDFVLQGPREQRTLRDYGEYEQDGRELFFVSDANGDEFRGLLEGDAVLIAYDVDGDGEYDTEFAFVV
jgi:hypothetical protein